MGPQDKCATVEAPTPDKHIQISNAIYNLESVLEHTRTLLFRIEGSNRPEDDKAERGTPALLEILNEAPARLHGIESEMHTLIGQIEAALFK